MAGKSNEEIQNLLQDLINSFKKKSLAYYLHFETSERKLTQEIKNSIKEKYGQEKFMPLIGWIESFGEIADSDILDDEINNYLDSVNYKAETFVIPKDRLKNMLWNSARDEGKKILSKFNS